MHDMSLAKIEAFEHTRLRFEQAASALPIHEKHDKDESLSADSGSDVDDTVSLDDSMSSIGSSQPSSVPSSPLSHQSEEQVSLGSLKPLPLQIRKPAQQSKQLFNEKRVFFETRLQASKPLCSPVPTPKTSATNKSLPTSPSLRGESFTASQSNSAPAPRASCVVSAVQTRAQERFNEQLLEFSQMLTRHIEFVQDAIAKTQEAQASGRRRLFKERRIGEDKEDEKGYDLKARIARLKKSGWSLKGDRFVPAKYQELCERALAEL